MLALYMHIMLQFSIEQGGGEHARCNWKEEAGYVNSAHYNPEVCRISDAIPYFALVKI